MQRNVRERRLCGITVVNRVSVMCVVLVDVEAKGRRK